LDGRIGDLVEAVDVTANLDEGICIELVESWIGRQVRQIFRGMLGAFSGCVAVEALPPASRYQRGGMSGQGHKWRQF